MPSQKFISFSTLISGFILHVILGTFHTWPNISKYFHSYLCEKNSIEIKKVYLKNVFSIFIVFHNIFISIGIILNKYLSSITITGIGLIMKIIANALFIFTPNIKIVTLGILICCCGCGLAYMPVIIEIWKYFPNNKGLSTSFALSGFGLTQLLFEDLSIKIINSNNDNIDFIYEVYSSQINDNFKLYLKQSEIFFSLLSVICILLIFPYDKYENSSRNSFFNKENKKYQFSKEIKNDKNKLNFEESNEQKKKINNNYNAISNNEKEDKSNYSPNLMRVKEQNRKKKNNSYLKSLTNLFFKRKEKYSINNKRYKNEYYDTENYDSEYPPTISLLKVNDFDKSNKESFISLIASYPFVQLTFIFFFTMMFGIIETSSMKNFGKLNGHSEEFLWYTSFMWKIINFIFFPLWGYFFDKIGFKRFYRIIISLEILISAICYYISYNKYGFIFYCIISALINSASLAISPTNFGIIFDNEKGAFLFGISCFLTNTFYVFRPLIDNLLTHKIYYLILYLILTLFSMLGFIILCFFIDQKHVAYMDMDMDSSSEDEMEIELKNLNYYDNNEQKLNPNVNDDNKKTNLIENNGHYNNSDKEQNKSQINK